MFYTKTEQVSDKALGIYVSCESVEEALINSITESYEDLANFNEALALLNLMLSVKKLLIKALASWILLLRKSKLVYINSLLS